MFKDHTQVTLAQCLTEVMMLNSLFAPGTYCCGPAPVKAVREGHTDVKYDVPFVYGEVNADKVTWLVMANGSKKNILSDTNAVGQNISTKAVGSNNRQDITEQYKHKEGQYHTHCSYLTIWSLSVYLSL